MAESSRPWTVPRVGLGRADIAQWGAALAPIVRPAFALAATAAAASWLGFYLITGLPFLDLETFRATLALHVVTGVVILPYLVYLIAARRLPGGSVLDAPLIALLAVYLLTTATSLNWRVSLEVTLTVLMAAGVFYVLSDGRFLRRWQVETALMLAVLAAALKALWIVGGDYVDWLRLSDAVRGGLSFGDLLPPTVFKLRDVGDHPNLLGGIFATTLPFFLVAMFRRVPPALRVLAAVAVAVVLLATFLSLARSAWLAAAVGGLTTAALLAAGMPAGRALLRRLWPSTPRRQVLVGAVALLLAVGMLGAAYVAQSVDARPLWLFRASGTPRLDVLEAGAEMVADYPLLGTGPGVFTLLYPEYSGRFPNHAFHTHNGFLQAAVDMGIPGVLAMLALAGALGWLLVRGLRASEGEARLSVIASSGALVAFATFSLFDAPNGFKGPLVALAAVGAVAVLSVREGAKQSDLPAGISERWLRLGRGVHVAARIAVPVALAGLLVAWGRLDIGHFSYSNSLSNAQAGRWSQAIDQGQRAVDLDPQYAIYRLQLGVVQGQAYLETGSPELLADAIGQLERGLELEPRSAIGHANLALLLAEAGEREEVRTEALAALRFANSDPAVVLAAGTALQASDWGEEAVQAYARVLFLDAGLADSPFWSDNPFRLTRFSEIVGRSALVFNPCALLRLTSAPVPAGPLTREEAFAACSEQVLADPGQAASRVALAEALIEEGAFDRAVAHLDYVLARQPDNGPARTTQGRWYADQGDLDRARDQWLRAGQLGEVEALVLLGDSYPAGGVPEEVVGALRSELRGATSQVQFHLTGILYYRFKFFRQSPVAILLPGEWQDAVPARLSKARSALARWTSEVGP